MTTYQKNQKFSLSDTNFNCYIAELAGTLTTKLWKKKKVYSYILTLSKNQISKAMLHVHFVKHITYF